MGGDRQQKSSSGGLHAPTKERKLRNNPKKWLRAVAIFVKWLDHRAGTRWSVAKSARVSDVGMLSFLSRISGAMLKAERLGLIVLACGAVVGLIIGGPFGLALAAVCLVVGLVLVVTTEAMGTRHKKPEIPTGANQPKSQVLILVKEVHARPQFGGRFQEIRDPNQTDLQFEVFANCWLVNDTDEPLVLRGLRMWLRRSNGTDVSLKRIVGDLEGWRLGRLRDDVDTCGLHYIHAAQETMSELDLKQPIHGGVAREGWVHFRLQNVSPNEVKEAPITVSVQDSRGRIHVGTAKGPHQVPGRIWPFRAPVREDRVGTKTTIVPQDRGSNDTMPVAQNRGTTETLSNTTKNDPLNKDVESSEASASGATGT
jgi:hypothetical protein